MTDAAPVVRPYRADDLAAVTRIWREVGWIDASKEEDAAALAIFLGTGHAEVAELDGAAECAVHRSDGTMRHEDVDLPLCAITAVTTSLVGRRLGLASTLTARALAAAVEAGAAVASLGMFDQGFYDRVGFGSGPYEHRLTVDPGRLDVPVPYRRPVRLTADDAHDIHAAMAGRARAHGGIVLHAPELVDAQLGWTEDLLVALGYRDETGRLTHCLVGSMKDEHGPCRIDVMAYQDTSQLLELLRLLQELADQLASVTLVEPPELQLTDLVRQPLRAREQAKGSPVHGFQLHAAPWWQARILDLEQCIGALHGVGEPVRCNLVLHDPVADHLEGGWTGLGGDYTLTVSSPSTVVPGATDGLPTLTASINALSRLWLGVGSASRLARTDSLDGPVDLLAALDRAIRLPSPKAGWDY
jgi:predicted acetyltransferase